MKVILLLNVVMLMDSEQPKIQTLAPNNFSNNIIEKPLFVSANPITYEDFQLLFQSSQIDKGDFSIYTMQVSAPVFTPTPGIYSISQLVDISSQTNGATIRYTVDGSDPSETSGVLYTEPVIISESTILKAIAFATGMLTSTITIGEYSIF